MFLSYYMLKDKAPSINPFNPSDLTAESLSNADMSAFGLVGGVVVEAGQTD